MNHKRNASDEFWDGFRDVFSVPGHVTTARERGELLGLAICSICVPAIIAVVIYAIFLLFFGGAS